MRKPMKERILDYMTKHGSITTIDAFIDLNCTRLSEYIRQIKFEYDLGEKWETHTNNYGETKHYKRFWIEKEN